MAGFNKDPQEYKDPIREFTDGECKQAFKEKLNDFGREYINSDIREERALADLCRDLHNQIHTACYDQLITRFEERNNADVALDNPVVSDGDLLFLCCFSMSDLRNLFPSIKNLGTSHNCKNINFPYGNLSDEDWKDIVAENEESLKPLYYRENTSIGAFLLHIKKEEFEDKDAYAGLKMVRDAIAWRKENRDCI